MHLNCGLLSDQKPQILTGLHLHHEKKYEKFSQDKNQIQAYLSEFYGLLKFHKNPREIKCELEYY